MKIYAVLRAEIAICCYPYYHTLVYGNNGDGGGIYLRGNFLKAKNHESHFNRAYDVPSNYYLSGGEEFEVEEVEVYQVIFI